MAVVLFDTSISHNGLLPLTYTKAVAAVRCGILTQKERWEKITGNEVFICTQQYLQPLYSHIPFAEHTWIDASVLPDEELVQKIINLKSGECIANGEGLIAGKGKIKSEDFNSINPKHFFNTQIKFEPIERLQRPWQILKMNNKMLLFDFSFINKEKSNQTISATNKIQRRHDIYIEEGASVEHVFINTMDGPVYIAKKAVVMEGAMLRGPIAICEGAVIKMGTKFYGSTTIGPYCTAGGEIKNSILSGYSNKSHDGYLGDAVIGEWCNLGAGTSNSNVKNTGGEISVWCIEKEMFEDSGKKAGVIMGDYCFSAINTSINSGTVTGIGCNLFGEGLTPQYIPSFTWGFKTPKKYEVDKLISHITNWKKMKGKTLNMEEKKVLSFIFDELKKKEVIKKEA